MRYGSVCSGIEAASVAWESLGWKPQWFSEIEAFPSAVLAHHWPEVPNLGDMTKFEEWSNDPIDVLVGGTPCQSFSVAGLRKGLADPRGNLMLTFGAIAAKYRPRWLVWENVPGVLSSNGGRDFGTFLGMLGELGYGFAYRVLDAQYFGVAQRRRRVFVVACPGDWRAAAAVLFERESLSGNPAPSREQGQEAAGTLASRTGAGGFAGTDEACSGYVQPVAAHDVCGPMTACGGTEKKHGFGWGQQEWENGYCQPVAQPFKVANCLTARTAKGMNSTLDEGQTPVLACHGTQDPCVYRDHAHTLGRNSGQENAVCFAQNSRDELREMPYAGALSAQPGMKQTSYVREQLSVRRLTPVECERLQGFPDGHTDIPWRIWQESKRKGVSYERLLAERGINLKEPAGQDCPDGPRYKAIGNSMAVPVMGWIGQRIQVVSEILKAMEAA